MSEDTAINQSTDVELLSFKAGGQDYAIDIGSTREIRSWTEPSALPDAPANMLGVITLRGEMLPLLDLAGHLGLRTPEINERSVIIVAEIAEEPIGLLVDAVSDIIELTQDDLKPPPETATIKQDSYVRALTLIEERVVRVLDLSSLRPEGAEAA